jgi:hypothetical protein
VGLDAGEQVLSNLAPHPWTLGTAKSVQQCRGDPRTCSLFANDPEKKGANKKTQKGV